MVSMVQHSGTMADAWEQGRLDARSVAEGYIDRNSQEHVCERAVMSTAGCTAAVPNDCHLAHYHQTSSMGRLRPSVCLLPRYHLGFNVHMQRCERPSCNAQELKDLMRRLLVHAPAQRLCMGKEGASDLKAHPWFSGFDWEAFQQQKLPAPHIPKVAPQRATCGAAPHAQHGSNLACSSCIAEQPVLHHQSSALH